MTFTAPATDSITAARLKRRRSVESAMDILLRDDLEPDTRIAMATDLLYKSSRSCKNMDNGPVDPPHREEVCVRYGRCEAKHHLFAGSCVYTPVRRLQAVS